MSVGCRKQFAVGVVGLGLGLCSLGALAQDPASPSAEEAPATIPVAELPEAAPEPAPEVKHTKGAVELNEVVVTARKRQESIQSVPVSVTAFSAGEMEQRGYSGLEDIAAATAGFTFQSFATGGAHGNPVLRGLAQTFTTARVQNVSFFLDGVYLQRQSMLNLGLVDMRRVEVVKGPQNALYGRNAFAGAVNYVTQEPGSEFAGYLSAATGDNERQEYRGSISGPLNSNRSLRAKFSFGIGDYDGNIPNNHPVADANPPGPNLRGNLGGNKDRTYAAGLLSQPTDALQMRLSYYRSEIEHESPASYSLSGVNAARFGLRFDDQNDLNCNTATVNDISPYPPRTHTGNSLWCGPLPDYASDVAERTVDGIVIDPRAIGGVSETDVITFSTNYDISDALSLNYLFGFADHSSYTDGGASDEDPLAGRGIATNALVTSVDNQNPAGYTFANTASGRPNSELKSFSHELRFDWRPTPAFKTSFGGYFSNVKDEEWTTLYIMDLCNADSAENIANCNKPLSAPNGLADATVLTAAAAYDQYARQAGGTNRGEWTAYDETITAAFASVSVQLTDTLETTLEARYTVEDKGIVRLTDSTMLAPGESVCYGATCTPPNDAPVLPFGNTLESTIQVPEDTAKFKNLTPRAIINWDFAKNHMLYLSAAKGVKTGGFNNAASEAELTYKQEENWTYELGSKNTFGRIFKLNGAIYYVDWTNLQGGIPPSVAGLSTSDIIANIGGANSLGIEIESELRLLRSFSIDAAGSYNKAQYKKGTQWAAGDQETGSFHCDGITCPADGDIGGNQLSRTSRYQGTAGLNLNTYLFDWSLHSRLDTTYQSKQYVDPLNLGWAPARQLYNASLRLSSPDAAWEVGAWVKNLTDEDYAADAFLIGVFNQYLVSKGPRRTFGASLKYNF